MRDHELSVRLSEPQIFVRRSVGPARERASEEKLESTTEAERPRRRTPQGGSAFCKLYPTLRQARPRAKPEAAMCVRKISAQCVLQFTPSLAAGCVLHRPVSRVIHCSELYLVLFWAIRPAFESEMRSRTGFTFEERSRESGGIFVPSCGGPVLRLSASDRNAFDRGLSQPDSPRNTRASPTVLSSLFLVDDSGRRGCAELLSGNFRENKVMVVRTSPGTDR